MAVEISRGGGQGASRELTPGDVQVDDFGFSQRGELVTLAVGTDHAADIHKVKNPGPKAAYERVTNLNPHVDTWKIGRLEIFTWTAPDGTPVEGILELPPDWKPADGPLPLLLSIHGGPTSCSYYAFTYSIYGRGPFAPNGWAVFDPSGADRVRDSS
jgi:dipeptidyl aminopeptidase/acylaminoacyl peptidase